MNRMRKEKIRQHTVPKRYLNGFALNSKLVQYDRDSGRASNVNVDDASVVKRMYSFRRSNGEWDDSIEDYFMRLEGQTWPVLDKVISGGVPTKQEKDVLSVYIARQMQRSRFIADFAKSESARFLDHEFAKKIVDANRTEIAMRYGGSEFEIEQAIREFKAAKAGVVIDPKIYLHYLFGQQAAAADVIAEMNWRIEKAKEGFFITSDNPVCVRQRGRPGERRVVPLLEENTELYFPLTRSLVLIASKEHTRNRKREVGRLRVREVNRISIIGAFRFVFSMRRDATIESLIAEHREDRIRFEQMSWDN